METLSSMEIYRASDSTKLLDIPLIGRGPGDRYRIVDIQGLGPVAATISSSEYSGLPGALFGSAKANVRTIVLKLEYITDYTDSNSIQALRRELYDLFTPTLPVELRFKSGPGDEQTMKIVGHVESHEPVIFSDRPQVAISILCTSPYFERLTGVRLQGTTGTPLSTLPYVGTAPAEVRIEIPGETGFKRVEIDDGIHPTFVWSYTPSGSFTSFFYDARRGKRGVWAGGTKQLRHHVSGGFDLAVSTRNPTVDVRTYTTASGTTHIAKPYSIVLLPKYLGF